MFELATRPDFVSEAERLVRDPSLFQWYAVALLAFVVYAYANEELASFVELMLRITRLPVV